MAPLPLSHPFCGLYQLRVCDCIFNFVPYAGDCKLEDIGTFRHNTAVKCHYPHASHTSSLECVLLVPRSVRVYRGGQAPKVASASRVRSNCTVIQRTKSECLIEHGCLVRTVMAVVVSDTHSLPLGPHLIHQPYPSG